MLARNKAIIVLGGSLLLVGLLTVLLNNNPSKPLSFAPTTEPVEPIINIAEGDYESSADGSNVVLNYESHDDRLDNTPASIDEGLKEISSIFVAQPQIKQWVAERGYLPKELLPENEYDSALLHAEAVSGNMNAQQLLAEDLLEQNQLAESKSWLIKAASNGSTKAILMLAQMNYAEAQSASEERDALLDQAKAWLLVGERRGDPMSNLAWDYLGIESHKRELGATHLTIASENLYQELERLRADNGLNQFTNASFPSPDLSVFQYLHK